MSVRREESAGQGEQDRQRYKQKIRDQIKKAIPDAIDHAPIIGGDGQVPIAIPLPEGGMDLPRFRPERPQEPSPWVGQGPGKPGDIVDARPSAGDGAGSQAGTDHQDPVIDLTLEEIRALMLEDLNLPPLPLKRPPTVTEPQIRWNTRSRHGSLTNVDAKATLKAALARTQAQGDPLALTTDDLRYHSWTERVRPKTAAVVYLVRDISGSMTTEKAYLARAVATYVVVWLKHVYDLCPLVFWVHDTEAALVDEDIFFHAHHGGGTLAAAAYTAVTAHMDTHYPVATWNRILLHFSDGDVGDPADTRQAAEQMLAHLALFGLVLTKPSSSLYGVEHGMKAALAHLPPPYRSVSLMRRSDVVQATQALLREEEPHGTA